MNQSSSWVLPEVINLAVLKNLPRYVFFTGKGGVGKTSIACATALRLADEGRRVLLISTDPASNLDEVLETALGPTPTPVPSADRLFALNLDPRAAASRYRERVIEPCRNLLPASVLRNMEEQLSGACTMEIAAFDEFSVFLGDPNRAGPYDHVVFDTAPTGHTLRLLSLPGAWSGFLASNTTGHSCLGPLAGLDKQRGIYEKAVQTLSDPNQSVLVLVCRPESSSLSEAERSSEELLRIGMTNQRLLINGIFKAGGNDALALDMESRQMRSMASADAFLKRFSVGLVPLRPHNITGLASLRSLLDSESGTAGRVSESARDGTVLKSVTDFGSILDQMTQNHHGLVMTMGKGGVGKTQLAYMIAQELRRRGFRTFLSTTDPAPGQPGENGISEGIPIQRIDPQEQTRLYVEEILRTTGADLDADARALLEEDLRSPCTEEIAVFRAFARMVAKAKDSWVVMDTAPTGHTLLLLDSTKSYHREVEKKVDSIPDEVRELLPRLRDPAFNHVLLVTLAEATPVHEAAALQEDLRRAGIEPFAWIINQSLVGVATQDPILAARADNQVALINEVLERHSKRAALVEWSVGASPWPTS